MLAPIPVDRLVLAQFDIGDQPEPEQSVNAEQYPPVRIDAIRATVYILDLMQNKMIRRY